MVVSRRIGPIALIFAALFGALVVYLVTRGCVGIRCLSFSGSTRFREKDVYASDPGDFRALYTNGQTQLRLEALAVQSSSDASQNIAAEAVRIQGLFDKAPAPYPGEISDSIVCSDSDKPVFETRYISGIEVSQFTGYVNNRMVFGACTNDQRAYRETLALFYCADQKKMYTLELISPYEASHDASIVTAQHGVVGSLRCR
ncbi:hypothetical protein M1555_04280 [Patescibacteria group bacterium]|nr:hypothetical protein [Patescibacteria group bacterium]